MNKIRYAAERFEVRSNYWRGNNNDGSGWICYLEGWKRYICCRISALVKSGALKNLMSI